MVEILKGGGFSIWKLFINNPVSYSDDVILKIQPLFEFSFSPLILSIHNIDVYFNYFNDILGT